MKVFGVREELGEDKVKWRQMVGCANASYPQKRKKTFFFGLIETVKDSKSKPVNQLGDYFTSPQLAV